MLQSGGHETYLRQIIEPTGCNECYLVTLRLRAKKDVFISDWIRRSGNCLYFYEDSLVPRRTGVSITSSQALTK